MKRRVFNDISEYYEKTNQYKKASVYRKKLADLNWREAEKHSHIVDTDYNKVENGNQQYAKGDLSKNIIIGVTFFMILSLIGFLLLIGKNRKKIS